MKIASPTIVGRIIWSYIFQNVSPSTFPLTRPEALDVAFVFIHNCFCILRVPTSITLLLHYYMPGVLSSKGQIWAPKSFPNKTFFYTFIHLFCVRLAMTSQTHPSLIKGNIFLTFLSVYRTYYLLLVPTTM